MQSGVALGTNVPGDSAFMKAPNGLGDYSVNYLASQQGEFSVKTAKIADASTYLADTYTFNFIDNGLGGTNLQVLDSANNPVANIANFDATTPLVSMELKLKCLGNPVLAIVSPWSLRLKSVFSILSVVQSH